jgi:uncharacterized membrane protein
MWALIFIGLAILALGVIALIGRKLWRSVKAVARDAAAAGERFSGLMSVGAVPSAQLPDRNT